MLTHDVVDERAWLWGEVGPADWTVSLPPTALADIEGVVEQLRRDPLPILLLEPAELPMPASAEIMGTVGRKLRQGSGRVGIDPLRPERFSAVERWGVYS